MKDEWHYGGRYYLLTQYTDPESIGWELEDVAPTPGRGEVLDAKLHDDDGSLTVRVWTSDPLPIELVHRFVTEAREHFAPPPE